MSKDVSSKETFFVDVTDYDLRTTIYLFAGYGPQVDISVVESD